MTRREKFGVLCRAGCLVAVFIATAGMAVDAWRAIFFRGSQSVDDPIILMICAIFLFLMVTMAIGWPKALVGFVRGE